MIISRQKYQRKKLSNRHFRIEVIFNWLVVTRYNSQFETTAEQ